LEKKKGGKGVRERGERPSHSSSPLSSSEFDIKSIKGGVSSKKKEKRSVRKIQGKENVGQKGKSRFASQGRPADGGGPKEIGKNRTKRKKSERDL